MSGNRTRVNCLEGSYAHHYTNIACCGRSVYNTFLKSMINVLANWKCQFCGASIQHFLEEAKRRTSVGNTAAASKSHDACSADSSMDSTDSSSTSNMHGTVATLYKSWIHVNQCTGCPISLRTWVELTWIWGVPWAGWLQQQIATTQAGWWNTSDPSQPNPGSRGDGTPCMLDIVVKGIHYMSVLHGSY